MINGAVANLISEQNFIGFNLPTVFDFFFSILEIVDIIVSLDDTRTMNTFILFIFF